MKRVGDWFPRQLTQFSLAEATNTARRACSLKSSIVLYIGVQSLCIAYLGLLATGGLRPTACSLLTCAVQAVELTLALLILRISLYHILLYICKNK